MKKRLASVLGGAALSMLGGIACTSSSDTTSTPADAGTSSDGSVSGDIQIGVSLPLTGALASIGVTQQNALRVAETQINQVGVLGGRRLKFKVVDDASDNGTVVKNAINGLLAENVPAILGPLGSGQVLAVHEAVAAARVVQLSSLATSHSLTEAQPKRDRYLFRTVQPDTTQGTAIAKLAYDGVVRVGSDAGLTGGSCRKMSVVSADDAYGNALSAVVEREFSAKGGTSIASKAKLTTTLATDYKAQVSAVVSAQSDCLALIVYADVAAQFLRELKAALAADTSGHDWSSFVVYGSSALVATPAFVTYGRTNPADPTSPNSTEGTYSTTPDPAPDTPEYHTFRALWQQSYPGEEPPVGTSSQYDAALVLALAIQQAGTATDGTKIRDALYTVTNDGTVFGPGQFLEALNAITKGIDVKYKGASGPCTFDDFGNVTNDLSVWQVQKQGDGTFAMVTVGKIKASDL